MSTATMEALLGDPAACDVIKLEQALDTKSRELEYDRSTGKSQRILQDEDARRTRLRVLLLEGDNYELHEQLAEEDLHSASLEMQLEGLRVEQSETAEIAKQLQASLRTKSKQAEILEAEVEAMAGVSTKSTKILTEKLALAHELATLRPELEHLRKEAVVYQTTVSEKLALQRELNSLEVELENEKRTTKKLLTKQQEEESQDIKFEAQAAQLQKELAKERRDRERAEREAQKALESAEAKSEAFANKLIATKEKLRTLKATFKDMEVEMKQLRASEAAAAAAAVEAARAVVSADAAPPKRRGRKRKAPEVAVEDIGTPDDGGAMSRALASKRDKRASTMPGDKSTFSITPFLNRTASLAPESPPKEPATVSKPASDPPSPCDKQPEQPAAEPSAPAGEAEGAKKAKRTTKAAKRTGGDADGPAKKVTKGRSKPAEPKKRTAPPPLSQVVEENEEIEAATEARKAEEPTSDISSEKAAAPAPAPAPAPKARVPPESKRKKRKLLGSGATKTLFDDDEAEAVRPLGKSVFGGNGLPVLSRSLAGKSAGLTLAFSPLKKDRRAAGSTSILQ